MATGTGILTRLVRRARSLRVPRWLAGDRWFDGEWYLRRYPDVASSGLDPARHFWRHGRFEGRLPGPGVSLIALSGAHPIAFRGPGFNAQSPTVRVERGPTIPRPSGGEQSSGDAVPRDVAVMIHAFYPDVLPELLRSLRPLSRRAVFLVSVTDHRQVERVDQMLTSALGRDMSTIVRVVPNRGRNFGPLVSAFSDDIRRHEYLLHLHTKKSLYAGYERTDWRRHLLQSLAGDSIAPILRLLADDRTIGVVQPAPMDQMPAWVSHWLGNVERGCWLFGRVGLDPSTVGGYLDYPVGGMFWARVDAIEPLLSSGLSLEDFEPEAAQTDGTLAHAIERSICVLAASRGYDFVEVDHRGDRWRRGWSTRGVPGFGSMNRVMLGRRLAASTLVSVGIIDALVMRAHADVADELLIPRKWLLEDLWTARRLGVRLVAVAGHGISRARATEMLRRADAEQLFDAVYVADEIEETDMVGKSPARSLWGAIERLESVEPRKWMHVGSDEVDDVLRPADHGLATTHVPSPSAVAQYRGYPVVDVSDHATRAVLGLACCGFFGGDMTDSPAERIGYSLIGPRAAVLRAREASPDSAVDEALRRTCASLMSDPSSMLAPDVIDAKRADMASSARRFLADLEPLLGGATHPDGEVVDRWTARAERERFD